MPALSLSFSLGLRPRLLCVGASLPACAASESIHSCRRSSSTTATTACAHHGPPAPAPCRSCDGLDTICRDVPMPRLRNGDFVMFPKFGEWAQRERGGWGERGRAGGSCSSCSASLLATARHARASHARTGPSGFPSTAACVTPPCPLARRAGAYTLAGAVNFNGFDVCGSKIFYVYTSAVN